ncbi:diacylglycerol kinase [Saccharopolyspora sp. K220]|uniref:NAD(P)H-dependent amine dehydrogenase family protein n=1 Tax=Saccharopolyspora soli TaxID=2926618 RepID=UPI001F58A999|nr:diacylglycerol kinase [Saccharopolyspora soli]MCI2416419.1 diacylglycerol kinase [Saccharopolyspora soli]
MAYRVVQWSTGNVGRWALRGIIDHPDLELAGVWVSSPAKNGRDAGELAGADRPLGIRATADADELIAAEPDCVVYTAMADNRLSEAIDDLCRLLRAGINVVASGPVFLSFPDGTVPLDLVEPIRSAAADGRASLWVNGIDPGWANDWLPLLLSGTCQRIDLVRCSEITDYSTYHNPLVLFDLMGFGTPLDETPMLLQPGVLSIAWGSVVRQLAAALEVPLDSVAEHHERFPAPEPFTVAGRTINTGTMAALRFTVSGMVADRPVLVLVLEHVTRLRPDLAPDWPQPAGTGCYRVEITGEPNYVLDLRLTGGDGDHNTAGVASTAMRLVNAVPAVVAAPPGLLTALDLPLTTGRGLVSIPARGVINP